MEGMSCCLLDGVFMLEEDVEGFGSVCFGVEVGFLPVSGSERSESLPEMPRRSASFLSLELATSLRERLSFLPEGILESGICWIRVDLKELNLTKFFCVGERLNTLKDGAEVSGAGERATKS